MRQQMGNNPQNVSAERVERLRADIRRHEKACGCEAGSVMGLVALFSAIGYTVLGADSPLSWANALSVGGWVIASAVVGKLIGLGYARIRLSQLRAQLGALHVRADYDVGQTISQATKVADAGTGLAILAGRPAPSRKE